MTSSKILINHRISVYRSFINQKKFQIELTLYYIDFHTFPFCRNYTEHYDMHNDICKKLGTDIDIYVTTAAEYGAVTEYNKYLRRDVMLFPDKQSAKKFIKEYIELCLIPIFKLKET